MAWTSLHVPRSPIESINKQLQLLRSVPALGSPKIRGGFLGVSIIRTLEFWGPPNVGGPVNEDCGILFHTMVCYSILL